MIKSQLKDLPQEQQEKLIKAFEKNPALFENIAKDTQAKMKEGKDQTTAAMEVMSKYQSEIVEALK